MLISVHDQLAPSGGTVFIQRGGSFVPTLRGRYCIIDVMYIVSHQEKLEASRQQIR